MPRQIGGAPDKGKPSSPAFLDIRRPSDTQARLTGAGLRSEAFMEAARHWDQNLCELCGFDQTRT